MATQNTRRKQSEALRKLVAIGDKLSAEGKEVNEGTLRKEYREQYQEKPSEISTGQKNGNSSSYRGTSVAQSVENYKKKTEAKPASRAFFCRVSIISTGVAIAHTSDFIFFKYIMHFHKKKWHYKISPDAAAPGEFFTLFFPNRRRVSFRIGWYQSLYSRVHSRHSPYTSR